MGAHCGGECSSELGIEAKSCGSMSTVLDDRSSVSELAAFLLRVWQIAAVQYVLDSVVTALEQDPNRKFIYVEQVSLAGHFFLILAFAPLHSSGFYVAFHCKCLKIGVTSGFLL